MPISEFLKKNALKSIVLLADSKNKSVEIINCKGFFISKLSDFDKSKIPFGTIEKGSEKFVIFFLLMPDQKRIGVDPLQMLGEA